MRSLKAIEHDVLSRRLDRIRRVVLPVALLTLILAPLTRAADWPTYQGDLSHSGFAAGESIINPQTASSLALQWSDAAAGAISVQPAVANGRIYWGSWDGNEHATALD